MRQAIWALAALLAWAPAAAARGQADADTREIAAYRLSMEGVHKVAAATRAMAAELRKDPRYQEAAKVSAEIKALEKKDETTEAEDARLEQLKARKAALADALTGPSIGDADSLSGMEARIRQLPPLMAGLRSANLTPREYATFLLASLQAGMVAGLKKQGLVKEVPKEVSAENVRFMEEHEAELQALQKELSSLGDE